MNSSHVWRTITGLITILATAPALSDSLDLNLNDDATRLTYARLIAEDRLEIDAGWLHHQDQGNVLSVSFGRTGEAGGGTQSVTAALGGRLYVLDPKFPHQTPEVAPSPPLPNYNQDGFALGLGGFFRMQLAGYERIGFSGHGYYAPDVLAFGDSTDLIEVAGRVSYSVIREAEVYLGLRYIKAGFDGLDARFDNGLHIGLRLEF